MDRQPQTLGRPSNSVRTPTLQHLEERFEHGPRFQSRPKGLTTGSEGPEVVSGKMGRHSPSQDSDAQSRQPFLLCIRDLIFSGHQRMLKGIPNVGFWRRQSTRKQGPQ